jgi:hypothetical protein
MPFWLAVRCWLLVVFVAAFPCGSDDFVFGEMKLIVDWFYFCY